MLNSGNSKNISPHIYRMKFYKKTLFLVREVPIERTIELMKKYIGLQIERNLYTISRHTTFCCILL